MCQFTHYRLCLCPSKTENYELLIRPPYLSYHKERDTENYFTDLRENLGKQGSKFRVKIQGWVGCSYNKIVNITNTVVNTSIYYTIYYIYNLAHIFFPYIDICIHIFSKECMECKRINILQINNFSLNYTFQVEKTKILKLLPSGQIHSSYFSLPQQLSNTTHFYSNISRFLIKPEIPYVQSLFLLSSMRR